MLNKLKNLWKMSSGKKRGASIVLYLVVEGVAYFGLVDIAPQINYMINVLMVVGVLDASWKSEAKDWLRGKLNL